MNQYLKFAAQLAATAIAALLAALEDGVVGSTEWVNVLLMVAGAVGVLGAGNLPDGVWRYTKTIVAAASAGLVVLQSALVSPGVSTGEWLQIALAALGALGVLAVPGPTVSANARVVS